jgi:hypothetical protein
VIVRVYHFIRYVKRAALAACGFHPNRSEPPSPKRARWAAADNKPDLEVIRERAFSQYGVGEQARYREVFSLGDQAKGRGSTT